MNKIQYIELLKLRGITELEQGESIGSTVRKSGGDPTQAEMVLVNEAAMNYYIDKFKAEEDKNKELTKQNERLSSRVDSLEERSEWLSCLEAAGVDNWEGYGVAIDIRDGNE